MSQKEIILELIDIIESDVLNGNGVTALIRLNNLKTILIKDE